MSVVLSGTASGALPCVQPIAAARRSMGKYFRIVIVLSKRTSVCQTVERDVNRCRE
jgi:hypothetical protein